MIKAMFAVDDKDGMGRDGTLPWPHDKEDMRRFRATTTGHVVVMGSRSWDDPNMKKPLPNRVNVVLSSKDTGHEWADIVLRTVEGIFDLRPQFPDKTVWICGGANVLSQCKGKVAEVHLTRFKGDYGCDTFLDLAAFLDGFEAVSSEESGDKTFSIWRRRK